MREKIKRLHKAKYTAPQIAAALKISLTVVRKILAEEATEQTEKALDAIGAERHEKNREKIKKEVKSMTKFKEFKNGIVIANTTPHNIVMQDTDGELVTVENNPDKLINASTTQVYWGGIYTEPSFDPTTEGLYIIAEIKKDFAEQYGATGKTLVIIGSIIAAQAYPEEVAAMLPVPGYERVVPNEKRMRCDQFTMYRRK